MTRYLILALLIVGCSVAMAADDQFVPRAEVERLLIDQKGWVEAVKRGFAKLHLEYGEEITARDARIRVLEERLDRARTIDLNCGA